MPHRVRTLVCLFVTALTLGCSSNAPPPIVAVEGTLRLNGEPLNKAEVRFIPASGYGPEYTAKGISDERGRFRLATNGEAGACACECYVVVIEPEIPSRLRGESPQIQAELERYIKALGNRPLPRKYSNIAETPLRVTVTAERRDYDLALTRD
jgi:hypothetical protein